MGKLFRDSGLLCLCLSLLTTAIVLQHAFGLRLASVPDDGVLPPLISFIHPGAAVALAAGYVAAVIGIALGRR